MTDMTDDKVKALLDGATPGRRVQFHGSYCPEAVGTPFTDWDTSHDMSVIRPDGSRYRLAHYKHASDAYLSQMAPDLARALLDARAELARVRAERDYFAAENASLKAREEGVAMALKAYRATFCHASPGSDTEFALFLEGFDAAADIARAALAPTPTDPGDGWTWHERRTMLPDGDARKGGEG